MQLEPHAATEMRKGTENNPQADLQRKNKDVWSWNQWSYWNEDPTTMYLERWGLLASPPGKASFSKNPLAQLFLHRYYTSRIVSVQPVACGVQAFRRARNCPLFLLGKLTLIGYPLHCYTHQTPIARKYAKQIILI